MLLFSCGLWFSLGNDPLSQLQPISDNRTPALDNFFGIVTKGGETMTYVVLILGLLFVKFRYSISVMSIGLCSLALSDFLKSCFNAPRPYYVLWETQRLHLVQFAQGFPPLESGTDSFPSGHTLSAFALYGFLSYVTPYKPWKFFFMLCALCVGFSRIWLMHHFWKDVSAGIVVGVTLGLFVFLINSFLSDSPSKWWNKRIKLG